MADRAISDASYRRTGDHQKLIRISTTNAYFAIAGDDILDKITRTTDRLNQAFPPGTDPKTVLIERVIDTIKDEFRGKYGYNQVVVAGIFGDHNIFGIGYVKLTNRQILSGYDTVSPGNIYHFGAGKNREVQEYVIGLQKECK